MKLGSGRAQGATYVQPKIKGSRRGDQSRIGRTLNKLDPGFVLLDFNSRASILHGVGKGVHPFIPNIEQAV